MNRDHLGVWCFSGFGALFPIVFAAVYWRRTTAAGVLAAVGVTAAVWWYLFRLSGYGGEYRLFEEHFGGKDGIMPVALLTVVCAAVLVLVSLATRPPARQTVEKFFPHS